MQKLVLGAFVILAVLFCQAEAQVTAAQFSCMFPRVSAAKVQSFIPGLNEALNRFQINTVARVQMFLAQTGHETDSYNTFVEYTNRDGTNAYCPRYDGGCRYRGRGAIQLTHKYNYQKAGTELGVDFVSNPDIVATPRYAFIVGGLYWKWRNLNKCSDARDMNSCTRLINGGTNGLQDRINKYSAAQRCITSLSGGGAAPQPPASQPPASQPPSLGSCTASGARGSCINTNTGRCSGQLYTGLCPGASHIRCCVAASRAEEELVADTFVVDELVGDLAVADVDAGLAADSFLADDFADISNAEVDDENVDMAVVDAIDELYADYAIADEVSGEFSGEFVDEFDDVDFVDFAVDGDSTTLEQSKAASGISSAAVGIAVASALIAFIAIVVLVVILVQRKRQEDAMRP